MGRKQHIYFAKPEKAQQDSMGWIRDSKKTPLAGKAAVEIKMKCQSFTKLAQAYHLRTGLWNQWKTLHCGPAALFFLGCLLVEKLSRGGAVKVGEGGARQVHRLPVQDVVVQVRREEAGVSVVHVRDHFPVRLLPPL